MRGSGDPQEVMLAVVNLEERVPKDHPLRTIKAVADEALERLSPEFDRMYSKVGRASVPPERLLKASLLISLYSVRSERAFQAAWHAPAQVVAVEEQLCQVPAGPYNRAPTIAGRVHDRRLCNGTTRIPDGRKDELLSRQQVHGAD